MQRIESRCMLNIWMVRNNVSEFGVSLKASICGVSFYRLHCVLDFFKIHDIFNISRIDTFNLLD